MKNKQLDKRDEKLKVSAVVERICTVTSVLNRSDWYMDSGAQAHTVNNEEGFVSLRETKNVSLKSAAGDDIDVKGIGTYRLRSKSDVIMGLCLRA